MGANAFRDGFGHWMEQAAAGTELLITRHGRPMVRIVPAG
ncbi:MAG: type II toxin-antitoxin system Phd/YefM family antitoxin [Solirubrobacteraceae bacterium]